MFIMILLSWTYSVPSVGVRLQLPPHPHPPTPTPPPNPPTILFLAEVNGSWLLKTQWMTCGFIDIYCVSVASISCCCWQKELCCVAKIYCTTLFRKICQILIPILLRRNCKQWWKSQWRRQICCQKPSVFILVILSKTRKPC